MGTFLANSKMNPRLAARVLASVRGRKVGAKTGLSAASRTALLRLSAVAVVGLVVFAVVREQRARAKQLDDAKQQLLTQMNEARASFPEGALEVSEQVFTWLKREGRDYQGDVAGLPGEPRWREWLGRQTVYVRVPIERLNEPERLAHIVSESRKDAFVVCLHDPPAQVSEKSLMKQVGLAYRGGADVEETLQNVHRLSDAVVVKQLLDPKVEARIERAEEVRDVLELQQTWDQARVPQRIGALNAQLLLAILDEPKTTGTPVELDGASDHWARVVLVDLASSKVLYRARKHLKPDWVSERRRTQYALGLNACRLAYELRHPVIAGE